ncbi:MAG: succinate dehydrogenase assembly factor 2 [Shimia sp.]
MSEDRDIRERRLYMRSIRRGIKEMDIILGGFARTELGGLSDAELATYDRLLAENDHDLYAWVAGTQPPADGYGPLVARIQRHVAAQEISST